MTVKLRLSTRLGMDLDLLIMMILEPQLKVHRALLRWTTRRLKQDIEGASA